MRVLLPLLALAVLLHAAPPAAALPSVIDLPGKCWWLTFDDELCVGQNDGCTGVLFRNDIAERFQCIGVYDRPFLP